uniref:SecY-type transporter protein n=1 Tax=Eustigmatophyceae sp. Ndem 8/9T-3m6.8 TaxID=2506146 RepID=A0A3R5U9X3_9STRA|nr:SecY-type transporter protein [Eustigmatophyceae sp. Ndem 8/9T-3m6.8]QAA11803.1 SecY-type transporter protein [Eustigmatophyceae sp. Ndem 8/9T-3m6.8]
MTKPRNSTISNNFKKSTKDKLLLLILIGLAIRLLKKIPLPWLNYGLLPELDSPTLLSIGITPLITSSILFQIFNLIPAFKKWRQEAEEEGSSNNKLSRLNKILTIVIASFQAFRFVNKLSPYIYGPNLIKFLILGLLIVTASMLLVWISEIITENVFTSGTSLILSFTTILDEIVRLFAKILTVSPPTFWPIFLVYIFLLSLVVTIFARSLREFPLISSRQFYTETMPFTNLPFTLNPGAVMALISTESLVRILESLLINQLHLSTTQNIAWLMVIIRSVLVVVLSYYCSIIQIDPLTISNQLQKMSISVDNQPPGEPTLFYLKTELKKVYLSGGIILVLLTQLTELISFFSPQLDLRSYLSSLIIFFSGLLEVDQKIFTKELPLVGSTKQNFE